MKNFIIISIFVSLGFLIPSLALSQSCNVIRQGPIYSAPIHHAAPAYHVPNVIKQDIVIKEVPVLVPVYQFQYQPAYCIEQQQVQQPNNYGSGPPVVNFGNDSERIKELAKALIQEMQAQQNNDQGPPVVNDGNSPNSPNHQIPGNNIPPAQIQAVAIAALQRNCASCHTGVGSKGDTIIFSQPGVLDPNAPWKIIKREIESGRMPPKQSQFKLTQDEFQSIRTWLGKF